MKLTLDVPSDYKSAEKFLFAGLGRLLVKEVIASLFAFFASLVIYLLLSSLLHAQGVESETSFAISLSVVSVLTAIAYLILYRRGFFENSFIVAHEYQLSSLEDSNLSSSENFTRLQKAGNEALCSRSYNDAVASFQEALNANPNSSEVLNSLGVALAKSGNTHEAIECFEKAIKIKPRNYEAWFNLGNTYIDLRCYDQAVSNYDKAIEINPSDNRAKHNRNLATMKKR